MEPIDRFDSLEAYCPQLGMLLTFGYCRRSQGSLPCRNLIGCWRERLPVETFLRDHFLPDTLQSLWGGPPKTRLDRILEGVSPKRPNRPPEKDS